jgi:hypothetical protein
VHVRVCACPFSVSFCFPCSVRTHTHSVSFVVPLGRVAGRIRVVFVRVVQGFVVFFRPLAPSKHHRTNSPNNSPNNRPNSPFPRQCPRLLPSTRTNHLYYMQRRPCSRGWRGRGGGGGGGGWGRGAGWGGRLLEKDWSEYFADSGDWVGAFGL